MSKLRIWFRRFMRRFTMLFSLDSYIWECESCHDCGNSIRFYWSISDDIWEQVINNKSICLCLDCFARRANKKKIKINYNDFKIKLLSD